MRRTWLVVAAAAVACTRPVEEAPPAEDRRSAIQTAIDAASSLEPRFAAQLRAELGLAYARTSSPAAAAAWLDRALEALQAIPDRGDRDRVTSRIAEGFAASGDRSKALELAARLGTSEARSDVASSLAVTAEDAAKVELPAYRDRAFSRLAIEAAGSGAPDRAKALIDRVSDPSVRASAQAALVRAYFRAKRDKEAKRLTSQLEGIAKAEAQAALAGGALARGDRRGALRWLAAIEPEYIRAPAALSIALKSPRDRRRLEKQAFSLAEDIRSPVLRSSAFEALAKVYLDAEEPERALGLLDRTPGIEADLRLRALIATALLRKNDLPAAERVAQQIAGDPVWSPEAFAALAAAHARAGRFGQALSAAGAILNLELRLPAVAEVLVLHERAGAPATPELRRAITTAMATISP